MTHRKWPTTGLIILGILGLNAVMATFHGVRLGQGASVLTGMFMLFLIWNVYVFKRWAYKVLIFLFGLNCGFLILFAINGGVPVVTALLGVAINLLFIFYFTSPATKDMFPSKQTGAGGEDVVDADYTDNDQEDTSSNP